MCSVTDLDVKGLVMDLMLTYTCLYFMSILSLCTVLGTIIESTLTSSPAFVLIFQTLNIFQVNSEPGFQLHLVRSTFTHELVFLGIVTRLVICYDEY